jgi:ribosomal-protein-alanine N-acetyltransferase
MILETQRLILDTWQSADWTAFRPIATDVEVMRYITDGVPWSDEQIQSFVDRQIELYRTQGFCRWKLLEKLDRNRSASVEWASGTAQRNPCWGRGLATEAAVPALRDAFERVRLSRIVSIAMPENIASTRIMQKLGLEFDSEFENEGVRLVKYAIERAQYLGPVGN